MTHSIHLFKVSASSKHAWWCSLSFTASVQIRSWSQFWKDVQYRSKTLMGFYTPHPQPLLSTIFPTTECLRPFHSHPQYATQILRWTCNAPHLGSWMQSLSEISSTHQGPTCPGRTCPTVLAWTWQPLHLGTHSHLHRSFRLSQSWNGHHHPSSKNGNHDSTILSSVKKPAMNTNAQFGLATLWRRAKHKFTPHLVRSILNGFKTVWDSGPSYTSWGPTLRPDSNKPNCCVPTTVALLSAMPSVDLPTTPRSLSVPCP